MAKQNFYDFTSVIAEEMEALLIKLKSLISAKKITDNLPENLQGEIDKINNRIDTVNKIKDALISGFDGGTYEHVHIYGDWMQYDEDNCIRTCKYGEQEIKSHSWNDGEITIHPTTWSTGIKTYVCTKCGKIKEEVLPKIPTIGLLPTGSRIALNVNGNREWFVVIHQGLPSSIYDESCNGTWLLMDNSYRNISWGGNNDYENSNVHYYLNNIFYNLFDSEIQSVIKQVKIPYVEGAGNGGMVFSGTKGLSTKVFLLSAYEVGGYNIQSSYYFRNEGEWLPYFKNASSSSSRWWLRSPHNGNSSQVWYVNYSIGNYSYDNSSATYGVRPTLILPDTLGVTDAGGYYNIIV